MKVVVADDDRQMLGALRIILTAHGYDVLVASDGKQALDAAIEGHPDLVVLDLGMPGLDGLAVIDAIRGWSTVPILVISGRTDSAEKVDALDRGADDYVTKPFATDELLARIRALVRRMPTAGDEPRVAFADVIVDLGTRRVTRADSPVRLTPTEWRILALLVRNPDRLITRETILTEVWGPHHTSDSGYLRLYLAQLRKKLEPDPAHPRHLITEAGMGYRFVPQGE
ncbi:MAG TPA: response regulator transcription factor [Humibacter sp.]|jgi:two-component system KDP operon response regulator KdpE|nr:response regulator transcription factor [Humibacter sp.]